ncbi:MAG: hypothetical protein A3B74_04140 [Candidatus Kerfeldbacteria bacterium RIFCSPHIGHO2_02_FULL_42_14]|uniref:Uracil-DNA glycosylase-like domain-containing protein n=1 Tax=Candidatus Kerfeldbacteria bacterium RIFCSPHIGHO2_02_FULL_42_14 TaxID=1798540 RepID=A0A1G2AQ70_9BACT|nr:MAG: hypothetical protein A3B74_04140 [Candidatus Kerfeldbacteria bacterium RIFCSPHIGHO2_02_FULL_42_14]OGY80697.1 MAG: hypothetical protein A3E60_04635 [Candidatus Kerfeldbacteria bacterium RIFCSPHIGHO2_12_FULL_42_13]OGY82624.1 MAG: hypothetical protein A3I91_04300 [Candidatus Kerfeldbacteria bacterium RIFCSPLOWO2_02_FULL_42_19]OGY85227.1 MAG: hypothetical protein A3G01_01430 [Candidatus Kerfeldbacteria bacterium RIFCSPLOWO2_12_FULL_43_9]
MQIKKLLRQFDELHHIHGDKNLDSIYGAGQIHNPKVCLVFMNPTGRNVASDKKWRGLKAPWIGTKNVWKMFFQLGFFEESFFNEINAKKPSDWDYEFAGKVYTKVSDNSIYITNLSKATQIDARPLRDDVFREYLGLFEEEINILNPQIIITFGNQVSSILLGKNIKVSDYRKKHENIKVNGNAFKVFPVYYPVGQGMRNIKKAKEDIAWIIKNQI